jgi:predicted nucleic acid-binding protein
VRRIPSFKGTLYLDSNIIIYIVEREPRSYPILSAILARANTGQIKLLSSELAILECLVVPLRNQDDELIRDYSNILLSSDIKLIPVSVDVLLEAARLRALNPRLRIPDAIHWATAILGQANYLLTNDADFLRFLGTLGLGIQDIQL